MYVLAARCQAISKPLSLMTNPNIWGEARFDLFLDYLRCDYPRAPRSQPRRARAPIDVLAARCQAKNMNIHTW